ncbi:MAG: endonuclease domain-containing protein [Solirubrobacteraceae bacterium]
MWIGRHLVDALWRRQKLVVEVDGLTFHSTRRSFEDDRKRDLELEAAGFVVIRLTFNQLVKWPAQTLVRLAQRLALAEAQLRRDVG